MASQSGKVAVEARVKADMAKDLAQPDEVAISLIARKCLDGRPEATPQSSPKTEPAIEKQSTEPSYYTADIPDTEL